MVFVVGGHDRRCRLAVFEREPEATGWTVVKVPAAAGVITETTEGDGSLTSGIGVDSGSNCLEVHVAGESVRPDVSGDDSQLCCMRFRQRCCWVAPPVSEAPLRVFLVHVFAGAYAMLYPLFPLFFLRLTTQPLIFHTDAEFQCSCLYNTELSGAAIALLLTCRGWH